MASNVVLVRTNLPIHDCAALFERTMKVSKLSEFKGQGTQFTKPPTDDAFGDLDTDPPTFEVMAIMGGGGADLQKSAVSLFAWDRGDHTELNLSVGRAIFAFGVKAKGKIDKFIEAVRAADPSVVIAR